MKRRGFLGVAGAALVLPLRGIADAICNPSLVHLFHQGRQFVQARGNGLKSPSLGSYFVNWYGHSSFLIHSGSQTKSRRRSEFQRDARHSSRRGDRQQRSLYAQQYRSGDRQSGHSPRHHLQANLESDPHQR